jgi:hypothetical protein
MYIAPLSERGGAGGGRQDRRMAFAQIRSEGLGTSGQADWVQVCSGPWAGAAASAVGLVWGPVRLVDHHHHHIWGGIVTSGYIHR